MTDPFEDIIEILNSIENDLNVYKYNDQSDFESQKYWVEKRERCWLHGGIDLRETNELERWKIHRIPLSATAQGLAIDAYDDWKDSFQKPGSWGAYYSEDDRFDIPEPYTNGETLHEYILRLAELTQTSGKGERLGWRALKSFLAFLKKAHRETEVAFIEHIFPHKMDVLHGRILRKIAPQAFPIPQKTAYEVLAELARMCRNGRPDACRTAAESLALCWICLSASRLRLPVYLESIYAIKAGALTLEGDFPALQIPTLFGEQEVRISRRVANYLHAIFRIPSEEPRKTILQRPLRSLKRTLAEALKNVKPNSKYGPITYVTLLSQPHQFGDHRPQPK